MNTFLILFVAAVLAIAIVLPVFFGFGKKDGKKKVVRKTGSLNKPFVQEKWAETEASYSLGGPSHVRSSIIEADKLVDYVLKNLGVPGLNMGERIRNAQGKFSDYNDYNNLWYAHKLRNNIAHESSHDLVITEANKAMEYYKTALKKLGGL